MHNRSTDVVPVKIDRTVPYWGVAMLVISILGQGVLLWSGQREAAIEAKHMSTQVHELKVEVKSMSAQINAKDYKDAERDGALRDLERRVQRIEREPK